MNPSEEAKLVERAQSGDLEAYSKLVEHYHVKIIAFLAVRTTSPHDAEDLAQDTFLNAYRRLPDFETQRPLGPWLRGIAFRLLLNHRKKHRPHPIGGSAELDFLLEDAIEERQSSGREDELIEALAHCREGLNESAADLLYQRYGLGRSVAQISGQLGRKRTAVAMQLQRLRATLKSCIEGRLAQ